MCWAAAIACIVNCVSNKNLTAKDVAVREYGSTNYDQGMTTANSAKVLRNTYKLDYTYLNHAPSETVILENIQTGYPLYGSFIGDHVSHAATIFGINVVSGYITVMDPMFGSATAYHSSDGFSYVNTAMGKTITLDKTICSVWE